ncbi:hypothetical protein CC1G_04880 [Coprinopsis cinerea okayama7|uniref:DUF6593 domain-containing protein n=1 Tax=Coprinopsis cinerea (strain Okayama-7 / 130 / ATCC MYA-4618 / FGSC 9003) TaxID=240176 RepID=A8PFX0_COPC7|nr:hypothetical protein CC1G_04880 [Coprinopsis cinerea okayama7\|eukprot:XP_001841036.1 hypothetical protein CC1G_04880 [Coprinopsis cinerea okayama7\
MKLILENDTPCNTRYTDETGRILYQVSTSGKYIKCKANLEKLDLRQGKFIPFASIDFHNFKDDVLRIGQNWETKSGDFFRKKGFSFYGRDRIFTAPDGKEYRWEMQADRAELYMMDEAKTRIVRYHRKKYGIFHDKAPASLEIEPCAEGMMDVIMLTYIYIEYLRNERDEANSKIAAGNIKDSMKP